MPDEQPPQPDPPATPEPPRARKPRWRRAARRAIAVAVAIVAGVLVAVLTVDLGPSVRRRAEREGSKFMQRPLHIGRLSAKLTPGVFVIEDIVIEGLAPTDRPFLTAKKITVVLPWWTIFTRKLMIESIEMTDWKMIVESFPSSPRFPNGRTSFPKLTPDKKGTGPSRFTTTLKSLLASRGEFTYEDHGTPWGTVARNLRVSVYRGATDYRGNASFSNGTIQIMKYEPFSAGMRSRFKINGSRIHFDRIDLASDGAASVMDGDLDMGHWPEQIYRVTSHIDFPTQKNIYFHNEKFNVSGQGDFHGKPERIAGGHLHRRNGNSMLARPVTRAQLAGGEILRRCIGDAHGRRVRRRLAQQLDGGRAARQFHGQRLRLEG